MSKINSFKLYSWNVLHIIHELNYSYDCSYVIDKSQEILASEIYRLDVIAKLIVKYASKEKSIICLQECPAKLLENIINLNTYGDYVVHIYKYKRTPKLKNHRVENPYTDCSEYLITLTGKNIFVNNVNNVEFEDSEKGSLVIDVNIDKKNIFIANIHCPFGKLRNSAFEKLKIELGSKDYIIIGDLNSEQWELEKIFNKNIYKFTNINKPTRISKSIKKTKKGDLVVTTESVLDHMIGTINIVFSKIFVEQNIMLSDHCLIGTDVSIK